MGKRQALRLQMQKRQQRNRLVIIGIGIVGVLLIALLLVLPKTKPSTEAVIQITPVTYSTTINKTSLGNPEAPVKLDVWEDFQCPGCRSYSNEVEPQIVKDYVETGKVYYTFHFFPFIDGGEGESHQAANAAACAAAQNRFWDYHAMLFANWKGENAGSFTDALLIAFAQNLSLDMAAFNQCFAANASAAQIQADVDQGTKFGVPPTPGIFVNGLAVVSSEGPNYLPTVADVAKSIETALNGK
jgi:protein-disulfide isomerase